MTNPIFIQFDILYKKYDKSISYGRGLLEVLDGLLNIKLEDINADNLEHIFIKKYEGSNSYNIYSVITDVSKRMTRNEFIHIYELIYRLVTLNTDFYTKYPNLKDLAKPRQLCWGELVKIVTGETTSFTDSEFIFKTITYLVDNGLIDIYNDYKSLLLEQAKLNDKYKTSYKTQYTTNNKELEKRTQERDNYMRHYNLKANELSQLKTTIDKTSHAKLQELEKINTELKKTIESLKLEISELYIKNEELTKANTKELLNNTENYNQNLKRFMKSRNLKLQYYKSQTTKYANKSKQLVTYYNGLRKTIMETLEKKDTEIKMLHKNIERLTSSLDV
jgi:hypothetical protein